MSQPTRTIRAWFCLKLALANTRRIRQLVVLQVSMMRCSFSVQTVLLVLAEAHDDAVSKADLLAVFWVTTQVLEKSLS